MSVVVCQVCGQLVPVRKRMGVLTANCAVCTANYRREKLGRAQAVVINLPCDHCGQPVWLDASVDHETWAKISGRTDGGGHLCLPCMDSIASDLGITFRVKLYWVGQAGFSAVYG